MISKNPKPPLPLESLAGYLRSQFGNSLTIQTTSTFSGGASNPTYLVKSSHGNYVLRSKPIGKLVSSAHAIDREYRIMNALGTTDFPVPKTCFYCTSTDVIGAEFYVMEYVEGKVFDDFTLTGLSPSDRKAIYGSMNETLAYLHSINPDNIGLSDYGKQGNYFKRQIKLWTKQYQHQDKVIPKFEDLASWLTANLLQDNRRTIVHGDYRLANILVSPKDPKVAAVLDWELSTLGHPLADLAYNLSQWYLPKFSEDFAKASLFGANLDELGIPSLENYVKIYSKRVGFDVSQKDLYYSIAFNMFRLSGIMIGVLRRIKTGTAKKDIEKSTEDSLEPTLDLAWRYANMAQAC